jgi:hypothetical protein
MIGKLRRILLITIPAVMVAGLLSAAAIEVWVRAKWDPTRGAPGFYVSDPVLGIRLNPGYDGWFAGVPARINSLGFRDDREYDLAKPPGTFRIIVLGDSVTFGHGTLYETSYPFLLEQRLKAWKPSTNWQVWNLGVPGYNTGQELAYLEEVGPRYQPDLVIVGFYPNDLQNNDVDDTPSRMRRLASAMQRTMQRHFYSYEFYKRAALTLRWRLMTRDADRLRLEQLSNEAALLEARVSSQQQALTDVDYFDEDNVRAFRCIGVPPYDPNAPNADRLRHDFASGDPSLMAWQDRVRAFQQLAASGAYRIAFFVNLAPQECTAQDRFYDAGALDDDEVLTSIMGRGTPVVSTTRAYLHYRPSQMPAAAGHAVGNANRVKADVLFEFLRDRELVH